MADPTNNLDALSPNRRALLAQLIDEQRLAAAEKPRIPRRPYAGGCPLSYGQQRFWFLHQLESSCAACNLPFAWELHGSLNVKALENALNEIVRRHEVLHTKFPCVQGQPVQLISQPIAFELVVENLNHFPPEQREAELRRRLDEESAKPFDLERDLMIRARVFRLAREQHVLFINLHHIAFDGGSVAVLIRELETLYQIFCEGRVPALPELVIQYADFAIWQRAQYEETKLGKQMSYWKRQLANVPPTIALPADRMRPAAPSYRGAQIKIDISKTLGDKLKILGTREKATPFMVLLSAFQILLHRYSLQETVLVGVPISGRNWSEVEGLIGVFVNLLALRADFCEDFTFREFHARARETTLEAYTHQDLPFDKVVRELQPNRILGQHPLFQVGFELRNLSPVPCLGEVTASRMNMSRTMRHDLSLFLSETENGLTGEFAYNTDLFERATIKRMEEHLLALLEEITANPDSRISQLAGFVAPEQRQGRCEFDGGLGSAQETNQSQATGGDVAPNAELECRLRQIWERVLCRKGVGLGDSFFDLGGHSLLAVRLFAEMEKVTGRRLPLATLFQTPTIEGLAAILRQQGWKPQWRFLVPIQPKGSRPPLFCVHAHGGHVLIYRDLARYLGPDQPVYGLQAAWLDGLSSRPATVEQMAMRYLEEIRSLQLEGPYHLCGYCSGGLVAYEMARQLVQAGQPVGLVALFDTTRPGYSFYPPGMSPRRRRIYNWAHYAQLHWYDLRMLQGHERLDYFTRRAGNAAKALAGTLVGRLQRATGSIRQDAMSALPNELELTQQLIRRAIRDYVPPAYPGRIVLFRANRLPFGVCVDPTLGWSTSAVAELAIKELPGFHGASVLEPGVRILAKSLTNCLHEDCSPVSIRF